jgi:hypothetical protein
MDWNGKSSSFITNIRRYRNSPTLDYGRSI